MPAAPAPVSTPAAGRRRRRLPLAALGLAAGLLAFGAGVAHLFHLRFEAGDVYPPYSTLRSDPLGAKVFFAGLQGLPGLSVERSLRPTESLGVPAMSRPGSDHGEARFTCFYLGASSDEWPYLFSAEAARRLQDIARRGGRVVVTFLPSTRIPTADSLRYARELRATPDPHKDKTKEKGNGGEKGKDKDRDKKDPDKDKENRREWWRSHQPREPDLSEEWGIDVRRLDPTPAKAAVVAQILTGKAAPPPTPTPTPSPSPDPAAATAAASAGVALAHDGKALPARDARGVPVVDDDRPVGWHTAVDFDAAATSARRAGWHTLYERAGKPVIVARPYGHAGGELILASDTYFLSNEGLHADPHPALLAALVGPGQRVLFDESHLGIREHPGMMTLARRYRLQGALAALGLLAALFVWRNTVSLVPPRPPEARAAEDEAPVTGRDAAAGFLNLLRRGVAPRDLPARCFAQWQQNLAPRTGAVAEARQLATPANATRLGEILAAGGAKGAPRTPAALYRALCAALKRPA